MVLENRVDTLIIVLGICLVLFFVIVFIIKFFMNIYMPFADEREFIRMEIMRSHGNERVHWEHELRRLYIEQIPFIGGYLAERSRKRGRNRRERM